MLRPGTWRSTCAAAAAAPAASAALAQAVQALQVETRSQWRQGLGRARAAPATGASAPVLALRLAAALCLPYAAALQPGQALRAAMARQAPPRLLLLRLGLQTRQRRRAPRWRRSWAARHSSRAAAPPCGSPSLQLPLLLLPLLLRLPLLPLPLRLHRHRRCPFPRCILRQGPPRVRLQHTQRWLPLAAAVARAAAADRAQRPLPQQQQQLQPRFLLLQSLARLVLRMRAQCVAWGQRSLPQPRRLCRRLLPLLLQASPAQHRRSSRSRCRRKKLRQHRCQQLLRLRLPQPNRLLTPQQLQPLLP